MKRCSDVSRGVYLDKVLAERHEPLDSTYWIDLNAIERRRYAHQPLLTVLEAVCLHSGLSPVSVPRPCGKKDLDDYLERMFPAARKRLERTPERDFVFNLRLARDAIRAGDLPALDRDSRYYPTTDVKVNLEDFLQWALARNLEPAGPWRSCPIWTTLAALNERFEGCLAAGGRLTKDVVETALIELGEDPRDAPFYARRLDPRHGKGRPSKRQLALARSAIEGQPSTSHS